MNQYIFVNNSPTGNNDILGLTWSDYLMKKKYNMQIPKAQGITLGALAAIKIPKAMQEPIGAVFNGIVGGLQGGVYFYPDSCELAAFTIKAGRVRKLPNQKPIYEIDPYSRPILGTFMDPQSTVKKIEEELAPDDEGIYLGYGLSVEYALFIGNSTPGDAKAQSFSGIFHTIEVGLGDESFSLYAGENTGPKWSNGNWVGGTYGVKGKAIGFAKIDWDYQLAGPIVKLEEYSGGECFCDLLTIFYLR